MNQLQAILGKTETLTFDCYGTLIDWRAGLAGSLQRVFGDRITGRVDEIFAAYVTTEAEVEAGAYRTYRDILAETTRRLASRFGWELPPGREGMLAELLPGWRPFADTNAALARLKKRFRLGVLSNIDRDLFAGTAKHFPVAFDFVVTAQEVGAYKPSTAHFTRYLENHGRKETTLHVGQSPYHDGLPTAQLGIPFVWINRYGERNTQPIHPAGEFADLKTLADAVETVV